MPNEYPEDGAIIRDGLILQERPMVLTLEARAEEQAAAANRLEVAKEGLGLTMPESFSRDNAALRRAERAKTSTVRAPASDIPRPRLPIAE